MHLSTILIITLLQLLYWALAIYASSFPITSIQLVGFPHFIFWLFQILTAKDYALILGMPGTGKTSTMVHAVKALLMRGASILLTSYTNAAVDNLLIKLKAQVIPLLDAAIINFLNNFFILCITTMAMYLKHDIAECDRGSEFESNVCFSSRRELPVKN